MLIECLLKRIGGTHVLIDDTAYHFAPSKGDDRHTVDVTNKKHIGIFLAIKEAYELADDEVKSVVNKVEAAVGKKKAAPPALNPDPTPAAAPVAPAAAPAASAADVPAQTAAPAAPAEMQPADQAAPAAPAAS